LFYLKLTILFLHQRQLPLYQAESLGLYTTILFLVLLSIVEAIDKENGFPLPSGLGFELWDVDVVSNV
jgi:hypothetical protein